MNNLYNTSINNRINFILENKEILNLIFTNHEDINYNLDDTNNEDKVNKTKSLVENIEDKVNKTNSVVNKIYDKKSLTQKCNRCKEIK